MDTGVGIRFENFDSTDRAIVLVEDYTGGTNFQAPFRSFVTGTAVLLSNGKDTLTDYESRYTLVPFTHDRIIKFPATGREYRLRDARFHQLSFVEESIAGGEANECANGASFYINDSLVSFEANKLHPASHTLWVWK